jgi:catalase (peroxidase I)
MRTPNREPHGVFTQRPGTLSNDFFVEPARHVDALGEVGEGPEGLYEGYDRASGKLEWTGDAGRPDLRVAFGAARRGGGLRGRRRERSIRDRLRPGLDEGHGARK